MKCPGPVPMWLLPDLPGRSCPEAPPEASGGYRGTSWLEMRTPASRGAAQGQRSRPAQARRMRAANTVGGEIPDVGVSHQGGGHAGGGERREPPGRTAQRAESRVIPARRDETEKRARQGSPVAKRRARDRNNNRRYRSHDHQHHLNQLDIFDLPEGKKPEDWMRQEARSGAAAAGCGAEGDTPREGR